MPSGSSSKKKKEGRKSDVLVAAPVADDANVTTQGPVETLSALPSSPPEDASLSMSKANEESQPMESEEKVVPPSSTPKEARPGEGRRTPGGVKSKSSTDERWQKWSSERRAKLEKFRETGEFDIPMKKGDVPTVRSSSSSPSPSRSTSPVKRASSLMTSPPSRLYDNAMEMRELREKERALLAEEERRQRLIRVSPKTKELAFVHWQKKLTKAFEQSKDFQEGTISFESCLQVFFQLGFISSATVQALLLSADVLTAFKQQLGANDRIALGPVLNLTAIALKEDDVGEQISFHPAIVARFREFFKCPTAKPVSCSPSKASSSTKTIQLKEFVERIAEMQRESDEVRQELLREEEKRFEQECPFSPQRIASPSKRKLFNEDNEGPIHLRLHREAEERKRRTEEQVKRLSKAIQAKLEEECTFSPAIDDSSRSFLIEPGDFYDRRSVVEHLLRQEVARMKKQDLQERFDALGKVASPSPAKRTIPARLYPKKLLIPVRGQEEEIVVEVILNDAEKVAIHVSAGDDASTVAKEFALTFKLEAFREDMLRQALDEAITGLREKKLSSTKYEDQQEEVAKEEPLPNEMAPPIDAKETRQGCRYYFDESARRWYVHDFGTGESEWL